MGWVIAVGCVILILGVLLALKADVWWKIAESWKSYEKSTPSDFYLKCTKISGCILALTGLLLIIAPFVLR